MKRSTIFLLIAIVILVGAVLAWISIDKAAKKKAAEVNANAGSQQNNGTPAAPVATGGGVYPAPSPVSQQVQATIKRGSSGDVVKQLQTVLNRRGAGLVVDGAFGPKTEAAALKYLGKASFTPGEIAALINPAQTAGSVAASTKPAPAAAVAAVATAPLNALTAPFRAVWDKMFG